VIFFRERKKSLMMQEIGLITNIFISQFCQAVIISCFLCYIGAPRRVVGCRATAPPPPSPKPNLKNTNFIDTMISKVLRDVHFSLNQPLVICRFFFQLVLIFLVT
jgi:hypothetical protein